VQNHQIEDWKTDNETQEDNVTDHKADDQLPGYTDSAFQAFLKEFIFLILYYLYKEF